MDDTGIDMQILSLTSPGVQVFDAATANALARDANDELAAAIASHPDRYAGLAAAAPQDPAAAAKEIERGVRKLGLRGVILNSHTQGEYLDDPKFWPIFEACEALDVPIYLHPNSPPKAMIAPFLEAGLDGAIYGFGVETGLHLLRIIVAGVFDRFPELQHHRRSLRRGAALLAVPHRLHAPRDDRVGALPVHEAAASASRATTCARTSTSRTAAWPGNRRSCSAARCSAPTA